MRPLGTAQAGLLGALSAHGSWYGGSWGCGWHWDGRANTERILDTLVARGLVRKAIEPVLAHSRTAMVWRVTEAGHRLLATERAAREAARAVQS